MDPRQRLIFALDVPTRADAERKLDVVGAHIGVAKLGLELFVAEGPSVVRIATERRLPVFLDLKLHDIPETVERAVARAVDLGVRFLTVHASGGPTMLERAVKRTQGTPTQIVAVTVLTSLDERDLRAVGVDRSLDEQAALLAKTAFDAGVRAFVCSPHEASALRKIVGNDAAIITPGVRPRDAETGDQKRIATCEAAIGNGADYVVVGRPIRDAAVPTEVADALVREIAQALSKRS